MVDWTDLFNDIIPVGNTSAPAEKLFYPTVHPADYYPVSIIEPNIDNGPWIAGGAVMRWFQNNPVGLSDIDVFCASEEQFTQLKNRLLQEYKGQTSVRFESDNAITLDLYNTDRGVPNSSWVIQLIKKHYFNNVDELLDKFDLSVCQFATDGNEYVCGDTTIVDLRDRLLRFRDIKPDSLKRYIKYMAYGFKPEHGTYVKLINQPDAQWEFVSGETAYDGF